MQIQFRVQGFYQCWAGTSLESWNIHWYWYQRTNQTAIYDLRQDQPRTNTCLVGTWGNTNFILSLYRSQYQVHTCLIWGKNQPWTLIPWPACYVFLLKNNPPPIPGWYHIFFWEKIQYQYQLGMFKNSLPAPYLHNSDFYHGINVGAGWPKALLRGIGRLCLQKGCADHICGDKYWACIWF